MCPRNRGAHSNTRSADILATMVSTAASRTFNRGAISNYALIPQRTARPSKRGVHSNARPLKIFQTSMTSHEPRVSALSRRRSQASHVPPKCWGSSLRTFHVNTIVKVPRLDGQNRNRSRQFAFVMSARRFLALRQVCGVYPSCWSKMRTPYRDGVGPV